MDLDNKHNEQPEENSAQKGSSENYDIEQQWADRLKINFDKDNIPHPEERHHHREPEFQQPQLNQGPVPPNNPVPPGGPFQPYNGPGYQMPQGDQLPPMHPEGPMPPTYMVWAIFATICCCLPAGIVAIIFSSKVSTKYFSRDYEGARKASERAQIWIIISIVLGIISNALYIPMMLMMSL